ncbi:MAG TPA: deoxyribodipyrimidine photo-lyase [Anaerolineae bacterium]|nr:deoxyribodipyrimidine photo-lyase [Anaerolineae bacterium]
MTTAIWWIRRDLRLSDNQALAEALASTDRIVPAFVFDPCLLASPYVGSKRLAFLLHGLRALDVDLRAKGSRLIVRRGDPAVELAALTRESGAAAIFAEEDISPYARARDARVAERLPLMQTRGLTAQLPPMVSKPDGKPYTVFTPFSRAWKALPPPQVRDIIAAPKRIETPDDLHSLPIPPHPALPASVPFVSGEAEAQRRLTAFVSSIIGEYADVRNRMDRDGTSQLSPYLRFGMLSARQAIVAAIEAMRSAASAAIHRGAEAWFNELIWREFYITILHHFPNVRRESFRPELRNIPWENDEGKFAAWCGGRTGYPVVDAAMRQLIENGWMHNRARMIVASFLTKDLLIDWRWGERWFMQHLLDGDPAANNGGWQWTAGTGTDAAPYFRVFNPVLQGAKFDPDGTYVRRWVPELASVPDRFIHKPWDMPHEMQSSIECGIGRDYPAPIVDHEQARERVLAAYREAKAKV